MPGGQEEDDATSGPTRQAVTVRILFLLFLVVPLVEIYFLIKIGSLIGSPMTILLVVLTAFIGITLVRAQGFATLMRIRQQLDSRQLPALEILEGFALFLAGALLLTPGFVTDAFGFMCLTPSLRRWMIGQILGRASFSVVEDEFRGESGSDPKGRSRVIDGEYREID
ncbi:MAG: FxsA family protein [Gammaproteobacteria bacterium]|nr:FxsA family protein [Gammaproteobacteria bacterium]